MNSIGDESRPSQLALEIIQQLQIHPRYWNRSYQLAQLVLAMQDFVCATNGFLRAPEKDHYSLSQRLSLVRLSANSLATHMGDLLWLEDFADTYADSPKGTRKPMISGEFPYSLWDRQVAAFEATPSEQLLRVKTHLSDVYEDCSAILETVSAFQERRIGHDELFWGASGLINARIHTLHHLVGLPGGFAGLLTDMEVLEETLFVEARCARSGPDESR